MRVSRLLLRRVALLLLGIVRGIGRRLPGVALLLHWVVLLLPSVSRLLLWRVTRVTSSLLLLLLWKAWVIRRVVAHSQYCQTLQLSMFL